MKNEESLFEAFKAGVVYAVLREYGITKEDDIKKAFEDYIRKQS